MALDLNLGEVMTERYESSITKPPSPTTEKKPFIPSNGHGDDIPSERTPGDNSHQGINDQSVHTNTMTQQNLLASGDATQLEASENMDSFEDDSDSDMPLLEFVNQKPDADDGKANIEKDISDNMTIHSVSPTNAESNADDGWMDILGNGLMKKKVIVAGEGRDSRPIRGARVQLDIQARLDDGTEVENSSDVQATMAEGDLNTAVDMCLALMERGEICELRTDPKYAYGEIGSPPSIPSNAHLTYTLNLKDVKPPLDLDTLSIGERIKLGTAKRERGNFYFTRNEHTQALNCYNKAIAILRRPERLDSAHEHEVNAAELQELLDVEAKCYNNLAAVQLKVEAYDAAIISSDGVIRLQPNNVKALFRKGKALAGKGDYDAAIAILRQALKTEPESKLIHVELSRLVSEQRGQANKEREVYKKMFAQDKSPEEISNTSTTLPLFGILAALLAIIVGFLLYNNRKDL